MKRWRRHECVVFQCGTMTEAARLAFGQLVRQAPRWVDLAVLGFAATKPESSSVVVDGHSYPHRMYDARDLVDVDYPYKGDSLPEQFKLIPGNTDLMKLRFIRENPGYRRYWFVEDDVRLGGDWAGLFGWFRRSRAGLIGTSFRRKSSDPRWAWWRTVRPPKGVEVADADYVAGFLPVCSLTPKGAEAIEAGYGAGWRGHDEALWPMLVMRAGLQIRDIGGHGEFVAAGDEGRFYTNSGVGNMAPGTFVYRPYHDDYDHTSGKLWHPLREGKATSVKGAGHEA